jgi:hypothetical protein
MMVGIGFQESLNFGQVLLNYSFFYSGFFVGWIF